MSASDNEELGSLPAQFQWHVYQPPTVQNLAAHNEALDAPLPRTHSHHQQHYPQRGPATAGSAVHAPAHTGADLSDSDQNDDNAEQAGAAGAADAADPAMPPTKVRKLAPKLDVERLKRRDIGLLALHTAQDKLQFKGKGHEVSDFERLIKLYEQWAHKCFGKLRLKDFAMRVEKVTENKYLRRHLDRWRADPTNANVNMDDIYVEEIEPGDAASTAGGHAAGGMPVPAVQGAMLDANEDPFDQLDRLQPINNAALEELATRQEDEMDQRRAEARAKLAERKRQRELDAQQQQQQQQQNASGFSMSQDSHALGAPDSLPDTASQGRRRAAAASTATRSAANNGVQLGVGLMDMDVQMSMPSQDEDDTMPDSRDTMHSSQSSTRGSRSAPARPASQ